MPEKKNKTVPFSLRLTPEERERLNIDAAGMPVSAYIRSRLFDGAPSRRRQSQRKSPTEYRRALGQLLGMLGRSELATNVEQLARAAARGVLKTSPDTDDALQKACRNIAAMKQLLMKALGIRED